jgi:hypothetical protein
MYVHYLYTEVFTNNYMNFFWDITKAVHDLTSQFVLLQKFTVE